MTRPAGLHPEWAAHPLWSLFRREKDVGHPDEEMLSVFREHGVVKKDSLDNNNVTAENRNIYQRVDDGWLVVNRMKAWQGAVGISRLRGIVSGHYMCYRPIHGECHEYLNWLLRSSPYTAEFRRLSRGVRPGQAEIDNDQLRLLPIVLPPVEDQRRIAAFLDDQVERIDAVVAALVSERQLVTDRMRAVLGKVLDLPGEDVPLRYMVQRITSGPRGWGDFVADEGTVFLRIANLPADGIEVLDHEVLLVSAPPGPERERTRTEIGDVLISITASLGLTGVVREGWTADANVSQHVALVRPIPTKCHPDWLAWVVQSPRRRDELSSSGYGGTKMGLGLAEIAKIRVPIVSFDAQRACAETLNAAAASSSELRSAIDRQVKLLGERKSALIAACVTGEFDVATASTRAADVALQGARA
jgi:type I restriction enzyme S subunit